MQVMCGPATDCRNKFLQILFNHIIVPLETKCLLKLLLLFFFSGGGIKMKQAGMTFGVTNTGSIHKTY